MSAQFRLTSINGERAIGERGVLDGADGYVIREHVGDIVYRFWGDRYVGSVEPVAAEEPGA